MVVPSFRVKCCRFVPLCNHQGQRANTSPAARRLAALALVASTTLIGCRTDPTNPFLANQDPHGTNASDKEKMPGTDPLAESLARLNQRREEFKGAAAMASDAANGLQNDVQGLAQDTLSETRQALATSLDTAEQRGKQLAYDAAAGAVATAHQASLNAQVGAIDALEDLPLSEAGPLLLLAMSRGTPATQQAASQQLARRWPPASRVPANLSAEHRAMAIARLQQEWAKEYGKIDEAILAAKAEAARVVDTATQAVDGARQVVETANQHLSDMQQIAAAYRQANIPAEVRLQMSDALQKYAFDADITLRVRAAQAMGETGDPAFIPTLMTMLEAQPPVQEAALAGLRGVAGRDMAQRADGASISNEEQIRAWQLWYQEQRLSGTLPTMR